MNQALNMNEISTLSAVLLSTLDEGIFFSKLSSSIHEVLKEHKVLIFKTYQDHSTQLVADSGKLIDSDPIFTKGQGLAAYVSRMKRAYISNNVQRDPLFSGLNIPKDIRAEMCIPVISDGMILCTVNVQSNEEGRIFNDSDVSRVVEILSHLKAPISNMRLYLLAKHLNKELLSKIAEKERELSERVVASRASGSDEVSIIGQSKVFTGVLDIIKKVSAEDYPVLFEGGSGVGKRQLAKKLHSMSNRATAKCTIVHCNVDNDQELEAEIFGRLNNPGAIEQSNGGSIVLKEIEKLSLGLQGKLIKALTTGKIKRVNSEEIVNINVRVLSTTRVDLKGEIEQGRFREDLFYRLSTIKVKVPSLAQRADDVKLLASHFINANRDESEHKILTGKALEMLTTYSWPGNLQELKSMMERTFILADGKYIEELELPVQIEEVSAEIVEEEVKYEEISLFDLEKRHIVLTLGHLDGNKTKAAKSLGITVKTLYNKLHNYGLVEARS